MRTLKTADIPGLSWPSELGVIVYQDTGSPSMRRTTFLRVEPPAFRTLTDGNDANPLLTASSLLYSMIERLEGDSDGPEGPDGPDDPDDPDGGAPPPPPGGAAGGCVVPVEPASIISNDFDVDT